MHIIVRFSLPVFFSARLQRTLASRIYAYDTALADGNLLAIYLIHALTFQNNVKFLVSLVGVQETAVLTRNERLERQVATCCAYSLTSEHLTVKCEVREEARSPSGR